MNKAILQNPDVRESNDIRLQFIRDICNDPNSKPFRYPVDENRDEAKNYYQIILTPMDLYTLESLVNDYQISDHGEFIQKLNLIWENAMKYNANENHTVHKKAKQMKILTHKLIKKYFSNLDYVKNIIPTRKSNRIKKRQQIKLNEAKENEPETLEKDVESAELYFECFYPEPIHISNYDGNKRSAAGLIALPFNIHQANNVPQPHIPSYNDNKRSAAPSLPPKVELPEADTQANNVPQTHIPSYDDNKRSAAPSLPPVDEALFAVDNVAHSLSNEGTTISLPSIIHGNDLCMMQGSTELHQAHSSVISCETAKSHEEQIQHQFQIIKTLTEKLRQKENNILSLESHIESMKTQNIDYLKQLLMKYNNFKTAFMRLQSAFKEMETATNSISCVIHFK